MQSHRPGRPSVLLLLRSPLPWTPTRIMGSTRRLVALVALFSLPIGSTKRLNSFAGPFIAYADKWHQCGPKEYDHTIEMFFRTTHFNPRNPTALQKISGNTTLLEELSDRHAGIVRMDSWSNNQWKENAFVFKFMKDGCTAIRANLPDVFRVIFYNADASKARCPIPKGTFFYDEPINWTFPNFPVMPYGRWRFKMSILDGRRTMGCMIVECITMPRL